MLRPLADEFRAARRDRTLVVVEGFHALKHALRFGAEVRRVVASASAPLDQLVAQLAPDLEVALPVVERVDDGEFARLVPRVPRTGVVALAGRPVVNVTAVLGGVLSAPVVLLENPRTMGNVGAVVRVAAAAGAAAVLTTGPHDPWQADAVRGAAGLQFALPVAPIETALIDDATRPLIALDPDGDELTGAVGLPAGAILAFGTERDGLTDALLARADRRVRLPMRPGVSSLNLATSVAAALYAWRLVGQQGSAR
ncbi:MAG: TrmH family RNA methyltransferase [Patulibacter sp.]